MMQTWGEFPLKTYSMLEHVMLPHYLLFSEAHTEVQTGLVLLSVFLLDTFACTRRFVPFANVQV